MANQQKRHGEKRRCLRIAGLAQAASESARPHIPRSLVIPSQSREEGESDRGDSRVSLLGELLNRFPVNGKMGNYNLTGHLASELRHGAEVSLQVERELRFGNCVQQVCNTINLALALGIRTVKFPSLWWLPSGVFEFSDMRVINDRSISLDDTPQVIRGDFYDLRPLAPVHAWPHTAASILARLRLNRHFKSVDDPLGDDELVIHVRSGDITLKNGAHPGYGQPPLAFYRKVIAVRRWAAVHVVTENDLNPVTRMIVTYCEKISMTVTVVSGELAADLAFLLRARTLVVGRGTFGCAISAMSKNLRSVHMFESWFCPWGNPIVTINKWHDLGGVYRNEVLSGNWFNSERQRMLMLTYPKDQISSVPIEGSCGDSWRCSSPQPFY